MNTPIVERHERTLSAFAYMARAFLPSPGIDASGAIPAIVERWEGLRIEHDHVDAFRRASGIPDEDGVSVLYPHVLGFRLQMALLTHRAFPLPIWNALQIRNRLVRHRHFCAGETFDLVSRIGPHRVLEKGIEIDLYSALNRGAECCWESEVTIFYRGRYGRPTDERPAEADWLATARSVESFRMPRNGGWRYGMLTGDYNPIHWANWYARRYGFRAAFPHPQLVAGMCMARVRGPSIEAQTLQLRIKGPLYFGAEVALKSAPLDGGIAFGLSLEGDARVAFSGQWRAGSD